ncbi:MAG TPA: DUF192 domain-containing protein [Albitalea sp.]|jgi:hypothetical protein|nr:DUF192 domain-containing protein [Albitalea sp.]
MAASTFSRPLPLVVYRASGFWSRLAGLLGRPELHKGEALYLMPCASVHTWFMPYCIDVVFVDSDGLVLRVVSDLEPWRSAWCKGAHAALELRAGQAAQFGIAPGRLLGQSAIEWVHR